MRKQQPQRSCQNATTGYNQHPHYTTTSSAMDQWLQWADDNGVIAPALVPYQWMRTNAPQKSYTDKSLGVKLKDDCIHVKDHTTGESHTFFDEKLPTVAQCRTRQPKTQQAMELAMRQQEAAQQQSTRQAAQLWREAVDAPVTGYFASKGLSDTHGARWHEQHNCWLVLVTDIEDTIYTVQKIYNKPPPNKFYLKGGRTAGGMVILGSLITASRVIVAEGPATGCTLREKTGETVVCALSCWNLLAVCLAIRAAYPGIDIVVAGDDDRRSERNIGRQKAIEAAQAVGGRVCFPTFCDGCTDCSDFNDAVTCNKQQGVTK